MSMVGTIDEIDGVLYVRYETTFSSEPVRQTLWWKIERVWRSPFAIGDAGAPKVGDHVVSNPGGGGWSASYYTVHFDGRKDAERIERSPVPCPPTRGKAARWQNGRWEKLMARGWLPA